MIERHVVISSVVAVQNCNIAPGRGIDQREVIAS